VGAVQPDILHPRRLLQLLPGAVIGLIVASLSLTSALIFLLFKTNYILFSFLVLDKIPLRHNPLAAKRYFRHQRSRCSIKSRAGPWPDSAETNPERPNGRNVPATEIKDR
jgi:hypothetical protein